MSSQLDDFLGAHSSLTRRQIECLSLQLSVQNRAEDEPKGESPHKISGVSEGSHYRVLSQAKNNVDQALYTLLLCSRMGIIQMEDFNRLLKLMNKAPSEVPESSEQVMLLVEALVKKIVML